MEHLIIPEGYKPILSLRETQAAIKVIKDFFQRELAKQLNQPPTNEEKRKFLDRFKRFFGLAPQDGASKEEALPFY